MQGAALLESCSCCCCCHHTLSVYFSLASAKCCPASFLILLQLNQARAKEEKDKGNRAFSEKKYDVAIKHFTSCIDLDPGGSLALFMLTILLPA